VLSSLRSLSENNLVKNNHIHLSSLKTMGILFGFGAYNR
jgi:hypothetical protein